MERYSREEAGKMLCRYHNPDGAGVGRTEPGMRAGYDHRRISGMVYGKKNSERGISVEQKGRSQASGRTMK